MSTIFEDAERLKEMADRHSLIGCVMGIGLHIGIDLVRDRKTKEKATREAEMILFKCMEKGLLSRRSTAISSPSGRPL